MGQQEAWRPTARHGPLASTGTIYETPDGRRCIVTFANRGADALSPVRDARGDLWVGYLLAGDAQPARFDEWERAWVPAELLRPVGRLLVGRPDADSREAGRMGERAVEAADERTR